MKTRPMSAIANPCSRYSAYRYAPWIQSPNVPKTYTAMYLRLSSENAACSAPRSLAPPARSPEAGDRRVRCCSAPHITHTRTSARISPEGDPGAASDASVDGTRWRSGWFMLRVSARPAPRAMAKKRSTRRRVQYGYSTYENSTRFIFRSRGPSKLTTTRERATMTRGSGRRTRREAKYTMSFEEEGARACETRRRFLCKYTICAFTFHNKFYYLAGNARRSWKKPALLRYRENSRRARSGEALSRSRSRTPRW
eukprot:31020-Pelagococcus_subviridis.AAC.1